MYSIGDTIKGLFMAPSIYSISYNRAVCMPSMSRLACILRVSRPSYSLTPLVNTVATFYINFRSFHRMDELLECAAVELRRTHEGEHGYPPRSSMGGGGNDKDFLTAVNGAGSSCVVQSKALVEELLEFR